MPKTTRKPSTRRPGKRPAKPTDRRKASDAASAADRAFVSLLIHELRTPLTALRGSLGLLSGAVEGADPEVRNFAGIADRNASRLASMLDEAAEYARLNDPAAALNRELTDVTDTVHRAIEQVQSLADERGITLEVQSTPVEATMDPVLVRSAIARLLSYALGVSPRASTITISIGTVGDSHAEISVTDGGNAVGGDSVADLFEPFSAVARRSAGAATRPGLALAIAYKIAQTHGGSLEFAPTENGGIFELRLPV